MRTFDLIKASFKQPTLLLEGRNKKGFHVFLYLLLLAVILSLPVIYQATLITKTIQDDGKKIIQKLPEFSIEDNTLVTKEKNDGFIYQTNSLIFTFDPNDKRTKEEIETDAASNVLVVGLLKKEIIMILPRVGTTTDIMEDNVLTIPYSMPQANILSKNVLEQLFASNTSRSMWFSIMFFVTWFMVFFNLLMDIVILSFFANIFTKFRLIGFKYKDVFKIVVYSATLPSILTAILQFVWPSISFGSVGVALTLLIYFNALPKRIKK
ncbi:MULTISPECIES: DUF1189 domain-containing protein [Vagococcus]|uniref:DUF1189 domain-containing protein n=1 Tax=Vagococcus TaxID=2737 RepID=UPI000E48BD74|nr:MULTISPECIES: DUF1189 domain-containing protein [Vagococcus]RHH69517.1 DUF1189 domain-containing protein [Vagococcus sp. AM17-17]